MKRLPDSELEIMQIIWEANTPVTRNDIQNQLPDSKSLAPTTILSFLSRLEQRGFVKVTKQGKSNWYESLVPREDYINSESQTMLKRFFGNSIKNLVVQLNDSKALEEEDIESLRSYLDQLTKEE